MHHLLNISHKRDKNTNSIAKMQIIELHFDILECFFSWTSFWMLIYIINNNSGSYTRGKMYTKMYTHTIMGRA